MRALSCGSPGVLLIPVSPSELFGPTAEAAAPEVRTIPVLMLIPAEEPPAKVPDATGAPLYVLPVIVIPEFDAAIVLAKTLASAVVPTITVA